MIKAHATTGLRLQWMIIIGVLLLAALPFPANGQQSNIEIVAYGDSLIEGWRVSDADSFPAQLDRLIGDEYEITNRGKNGAETEILLDELDEEVLNENPDMVILFAGGADLIPDFDNDGRVPAEETFANLEEIVDRLQEEDITVILLGHGSYDIPGFTYVDYTSEFRDLAEDTDVYFVPDATGDIGLDSEYTTSDLVHPNARGYSLITREVFPVFQEAVYEEFPGAPLSGSCQVNIDSQEDRPELVFANEEEAVTGQQVDWEAFAVGGFGNYNYEWTLETDTDSGDSSPRGQTVSIDYEEDGSKSAEYRVTSETDDGEDSQQETIQCAQTIDVETAPVGGKCEVAMDIDNDNDEVEIRWRVDAVGGTGEYEYTWTRDGESNTADEDRELVTDFDRDNTGTKRATVEIDSGSEDAELTCQAHIPDENETDDEDAPLERAGCDLVGYDLEVGDQVEWGADIDPFYREDDEGDRFATTTLEWSGTDGLSTTSNPARITYESTGVKSGRVDIDSATGEDIFLECEMKIIPDTDGETRGGEGCFIATAAYGTKLADDIDVLRDLRDNILKKSWVGRKLVNTYYEVSPPIADTIADNELLQSVTRTLLHPVVAGARLAVR